MDTSTHSWFKTKINDFTFKAAASKTGINFSTLRRHLMDENKNSSSAETIVAICRAYGINPIEGLVASNIIKISEAQDYLESVNFQESIRELPLPVLFTRLREELRQIEVRAIGQTPEQYDLKSEPLGNPVIVPDYSNLSALEVRKNEYRLAAKAADLNIGFDDLPNAP